MYYAGIGSRSTPTSVLTLMRLIGYHMAHDANYTLRSGAAIGADSAFEHGCDQANGTKEIFTAQSDIPPWAFDTVNKYHPAPYRLSPFARRLMARNAMQIFGSTGNTPVERIICWTPNGLITGGTGQALRIALDYDTIKIHNLGIESTYQHYRRRIKSNQP